MRERKKLLIFWLKVIKNPLFIPERTDAKLPPFLLFRIYPASPSSFFTAAKRHFVKCIKQLSEPTRFLSFSKELLNRKIKALCILTQRFPKILTKTMKEICLKFLDF
ncbi:MAG: hypothetical protein ACI4TE_09065 [Alphaproteobacteria bacterium]